MSKHTPGPWEAFRNTSYWEVKPSEGGGDSGIPFTVGDTCSSEPGNPDGGLQEANARLMAAAPELLEALQCAAQSAGFQYMTHETRMRIDAAIAKATGSQP